MVVDAGPRAEEHDRLFHALADPTRRDIVRVVLRSEQTVSALARRYPMSFAAVQKHVAVLEQARLVTKHPRGRERVVRGRIDGVRRADRLLDELESIWRTRMERFAEVLADTDHETGHDAGQATGHDAGPEPGPARRTRREQPWASPTSAGIPPHSR
jgi:DNA-binding transcriptional ArsR family regulator